MKKFPSFIFLSGGGSANQTQDLDKIFVEKVKEGKNFIYPSGDEERYLGLRSLL